MSHPLDDTIRKARREYRRCRRRARAARCRLQTLIRLRDLLTAVRLAEMRAVRGQRPAAQTEFPRQVDRVTGDPERGVETSGRHADTACVSGKSSDREEPSTVAMRACTSGLRPTM